MVSLGHARRRRPSVSLFVLQRRRKANQRRPSLCCRVTGSTHRSPRFIGVVSMDRREFLQSSMALGAISTIDSPVLRALSERKLKAEMPVETAPHANVADRRQYTHLEAMGRLLTGI